MAKRSKATLSELEKEIRILRKKIMKSNEPSSKPSTHKKRSQNLDPETLKKKTEEYLSEVRKIFKKLDPKKVSVDDRMEMYFLEKLCEKCATPDHDELLLLCDICDDAYHTFCLNPVLKKLPQEDEEWICPPCAELKNKMDESPKEMRQSTLEEHFIIPTKTSIIQQCHHCEEDIEEPAPSKLSGKKPSKRSYKEMCVKCRNMYHAACFNKSKSAILCSTCERDVKTATPNTNKTLFEFFTVKSSKHTSLPDDKKILKDSMDVESESTMEGKEEIKEEVELETSKKAKRSRSKKSSKKLILTKKKTPFFKLPKLSEEKELLQQKALLAKALISKNLTFDDDLCSSNPECRPEANNATLEPNLQIMDQQNLELFNKFKEMTRNGNYAPVNVIEDKLQGFIVQAAENIPSRTLIAEYVGEVDFARNRLFDKNDSIMDLLRTTRSSTSLVICPESRGNLARFLSGINNFKDDAQHKLNVTDK